MDFMTLDVLAFVMITLWIICCVAAIFLSIILILIRQLALAGQTVANFPEKVSFGSQN